MAGRSARVLADMIKNEDSSSLNQFGTELVHGLAVVAGRMEALEAQRICGELAQNPKALVDPSVGSIDRDTTDLAVLVHRMNSVDAERIRAEAVRAINDFVERNPSTVIAASALVQLATLMEPLEAERLCRRANRIVGDALAFDSDDADLNLVWSCGGRETNESGGGGARAGRCADTGDGAVDAPVAGGKPRRMPRAGWRQEQRPGFATARFEICFAPGRPDPEAPQDRRGFDSAVAELLQRLASPRRQRPWPRSSPRLMCSEGDICWEPEREPLSDGRFAEDARLHAAFVASPDGHEPGAKGPSRAAHGHAIHRDWIGRARRGRIAGGRALAVPLEQSGAGGPAQDADVHRQGPPGRARPTGEPSRPPLRQPLGVCPLRLGESPFARPHDPAAAPDPLALGFEEARLR